VTDKRNHKLDQLAEPWNEAEIARPSLGRWINQLDAGDQAIALRLLDCMQGHGWARLIRECRLLHQRICTDLEQDGFDTAPCCSVTHGCVWRRSSPMTMSARNENCCEAMTSNG